MTEMSTTEIESKLRRLAGNPLYSEDDREFVYESLPQLKAMIARLDRSLEGCGRERAIQELTRLKSALPHTKKMDPESREVFIAEAALAPIFALRQFVTDWYKTERFWPSIAEMNEEVERLVKRYSEMRRRLVNLREQLIDG